MTDGQSDSQTVRQSESIDKLLLGAKNENIAWRDIDALATPRMAADWFVTVRGQRSTLDTVAFPGTAASAVVCKVFDLLKVGFGGHLLK